MFFVRNAWVIMFWFALAAVHFIVMFSNEILLPMVMFNIALSALILDRLRKL